MRNKGPALALLITCLTVFGLNCGKAATAPATRYTCTGSTSTCLRIETGWTFVGKTVSDQGFLTASVVTLPDGGIRLYGNTTFLTDSYKHAVSWISTDGGLTFTQETGERLVGNDAGMPNVIIMPDGRFRMYCADTTITLGTMGGRGIISAISDDGLTFTREPGDRLTYTGTGNEKYGILGPNVIALADGTYRMYYRGFDGLNNIAKILSAVSVDGLTWTRENGVRWDPRDLCPAVITTGNPKPYVDSSGVTHLFVSGTACTSLLETDDRLGIYDATSTDGLVFRTSSTPIVEGYYATDSYKGSATDPRYFPEDPAVVLTPGGFLMFVYVNFSSTGASAEDIGYFTVSSSTFH